MYAQPFEARIAHLEGAFDRLSERLGSFERLTMTRFDQVDRRIDSRDRSSSSRFTWMLGVFALNPNQKP
jgi:hypothetical protein